MSTSHCYKYMCSRERGGKGLPLHSFAGKREKDRETERQRDRETERKWKVHISLCTDGGRWGGGGGRGVDLPLKRENGAVGEEEKRIRRNTPNIEETARQRARERDG